MLPRHAIIISTVDIPTCELGFSPEYDLERGVKETIAWYKDKGWL